MSRTKGAKNKKTLLKEKVHKEIIPAKVSPDEPKLKLALRLFTLERKVHDDFIIYITKFGDPKLYESYIINELMIKYIDRKIKLKIDVALMHDYMSVYGKIGFEPTGKPGELTELEEFKAANRLLARTTNSFIRQYQYAVFVDPDVKVSMHFSKYNTSYIINELLKLYIKDEIKIDTRDFRIREWEPLYQYAMKKKLKEEKLNSKHNA
jgi:hypothetical protein